MLWLGHIRVSENKSLAACVGLRCEWYLLALYKVRLGRLQGSKEKASHHKSFRSKTIEACHGYGLAVVEKVCIMDQQCWFHTFLTCVSVASCNTNIALSHSLQCICQ